MRLHRQLRVRVDDELVLDAGTCEEVSGPHGPERLIRPPATTLFHQVLAYLKAKPDPPKRPSARQLDPAIKVVYEETTWADFTAALNTGRIDLSIAGTFATIPRAKVVAFTQPLVYLGRSAIVRAGDARFDPTKGPLQFDRPDVKVGVVEGEASHEFVKANFRHQETVVVFSGSDLSQCLAAVSAGQVDVGMSDALETAKYAKAHHDVADLFADQPYDLTPIAWAVRQDDVVWLAFLDTALQTLETQGKLAQFERKYEFRWTHPVREYRLR